MTTEKKDIISIVVPCYNEEDVILETVDRLSKVCSTIDCVELELIFVDDGSTDQTRTILKSCSKNSCSRFGRVELLISSHPAQAGLFSTRPGENPA